MIPRLARIESHAASRRSIPLGRLLGFLLLLLLGSGCATPKPPFPTIPPWSATDASAIVLSEAETTLWDEAAELVEELESESSIIEREAFSAYLSEMLGKVTPGFEETRLQFRVHVIESAERNAVALSNGSILVSSALLACLDNEAQLAFLLGHEATHIVERHSILAERYDEMTTSYVDRMSLSRRLESRADYGALERMADAQYPPIEAVEMLKHLEVKRPSYARRIRSWESHADLSIRSSRIWTSGVGADKPLGPRYKNRYQAAIDPVRLETALLLLEDGDSTNAAMLVDRHIERFPDSGRAYFLRAEIAKRANKGMPMRDEIVADYERAIELSPEEPDALRALGLILHDREEFARSAALFTRYLSARPDAIDRKLIERYIADSNETPTSPPVSEAL